MRFSRAATLVLGLLVPLGVLFGILDTPSVSTSVGIVTGAGAFGIIVGALVFRLLKYTKLPVRSIRWPSAALSFVAAGYLFKLSVMEIISLYLYSTSLEHLPGRHSLGMLGSYLTCCMVACPVAAIFGFGAGQLQPDPHRETQSASPTR
jgi:high-affinity Fe2+/Pb2+ permease